MSTVAYARLAGRRGDRVARPRSARGTGADGPGAYVSVAAALVPAEVLAAHAAVIAYLTKTSEDGMTVTLTEPDTAAKVFWALAVLSVLLYVAARGWRLDGWRDYARAALPPLAFVAWTMLQHATAFDGVVRSISDASRFSFAVLLAVVVAFAAGQLEKRAAGPVPDVGP